MNKEETEESAKVLVELKKVCKNMINRKGELIKQKYQIEQEIREIEENMAKIEAEVSKEQYKRIIVDIVEKYSGEDKTEFVTPDGT